MVSALVGQKTRRVVVVAFRGVEALDALGPVEIFSGANRLFALRRPRARPAYAVTIVSPHGRDVTLAHGVVLPARASARGFAGTIDTLIVPGAFDVEAMLAQPHLASAVRRLARRARRVVSVCSGAFVLAEAGLLDGRRATTHWAGCAELAARYPLVRVEPDPIFVRDGHVYTSAGVTAGMDLALALVEEDLGREVALEIARWFVMYLRRPGGQSQFSVRLADQTAEREPLRDLLRFIGENPAGDLSVPALARRAGMSPRHFARVFTQELGTTPARHVALARLEAARQRLEESDEPLKRIADRSGFFSVESLRRSFQRSLQVTPGEYRQRFRSQPARA